jgi:alkylation response protein AidB-like acyl-CoA dehydrogenase
VSLAYGMQREHRGLPIARKFPTVQALIADIFAQVESARWLVYRAATMRDGVGGAAAEAEFVCMAATAKLVASQAGVRAASQAMQVHGAYGYVNEAAISRIYRDVKAYEMIQGTVEIQRVIVARELLRSAGGRS